MCQYQGVCVKMVIFQIGVEQCVDSLGVVVGWGLVGVFYVDYYCIGFWFVQCQVLIVEICVFVVGGEEKFIVIGGVNDVE